LEHRHPAAAAHAVIGAFGEGIVGAVDAAAVVPGVEIIGVLAGRVEVQKSRATRRPERLPEDQNAQPKPPARLEDTFQWERREHK